MGSNHSKSFGVYLENFVYGGIDGSVTTFAVVAGVIGASLPPFIVLILGFANLFADGFSMAVSSYMSEKSRIQYQQTLKNQEVSAISKKPKEERKHLREIFEKKGFTGKVLDSIISTISKNRDVWIDTMVKEEICINEENKSPIKTALVTFISFNFIGLIPLLAFIVSLFYPLQNVFLYSIVLTSLAFFIVGSVKGKIVHKNWVVSGLQTLAVGGLASIIAFLVGFSLRGLA